MPKAPRMSLYAGTLTLPLLSRPSPPFSSPKSTSGNLRHSHLPPGTSSAPDTQSAALRVWNLPQPPSCLGPHPPGSCSGCGPLSLPMLAGLLAADAVVSLLIVAVVFVWACPHRRPTRGEGRDRVGPGGRGVPREGVPREGSPRKALEEMLGKPWGRCRGELRRKPLRQGVPRKVEMWVSGRWSGLMLSLPHPQKMTKSTSTCLAGADPLVSETFDF